ncbi:MAG: T9SS type A sorting domain-containing protein [Rhodothermales bacterium]|nr:T9SS type A sorting domain-containing protein [Rhodothermales bacterium]
MPQATMIVTKPSVRLRASLAAKAFICALLLLSASPEAATAQTYDVTLYVDTSGSDLNPGTSSSPLRTVQKAADKAVQNKNNDLSTRVLIRPGTYREFVDVTTWTNWPTNDPNNAERMAFEGTDPNNVPVISGADVFTNWTQQGNLFTHNWPYNWGVYTAPWQDTIVDLEDVVLRREMVYLNDSRLDPVLAQNQLIPGTFFVNEATNLLYVYPPSNVNFSNANVEVAIREGAWDSQYEFNIQLKNIRFEKTTDAWDNARGLFRSVNCDDMTIDNVEFRDANWTGAYIGEAENVTITNIKANDNGGRGFATWRLKGLLMQDSESLRNNWRGYLGNFTGWTVGNNVESSHDVQLVNHNASDNFSRGLWFDTDVIDAVIDNATINNNLNDGFFLEAVQGPITLKNSDVKNNLRNGMFSGMAENVTLQNNVFENNGQAAIVISGNNNGRGINNFETGAYQTVLTRYWTVNSNEFIGSGPYLIGTTVNSTRWAEFIGNLTADFNYWCDNDKSNVFRRDGGVLLSFAGWKNHTGQELGSQFCNPVLPVELTTFAATVDGDGVVLSWQTLSEINNAGFDIEQEVDNSFQRVGFAIGNGTTATANNYTFRVDGLDPGAYRFRLKQIDLDGSFTYSAIVESVVGLQQVFLLSEIYPNPFSASGTVRLAVRDELPVSIELYDLLGKRIQTIFDGTAVPGGVTDYSIDGADIPSGIYLVRIKGAQFQQTRKVIVAH